MPRKQTRVKWAKRCRGPYLWTKCIGCGYWFLDGDHFQGHLCEVCLTKEVQLILPGMEENDGKLQKH